MTKLSFKSDTFIIEIHKNFRNLLKSNIKIYKKQSLIFKKKNKEYSADDLL